MTEVENAAKQVTDTAKSMLESYQKKWTSIAKDNMEIAAEFGHALSTAQTPAAWFEVTTEYSKKRFDAFQRHLKELMSPPQI